MGEGGEDLSGLLTGAEPPPAGDIVAQIVGFGRLAGCSGGQGLGALSTLGLRVRNGRLA